MALTEIYNFDTPTAEPFGLCFDGVHIWHTSKYLRAFPLPPVSDYAIYCLTKQGVQLKKHVLPFRPQGITFDGQHLIVSDITNDKLVYYTRDGIIIKSLATVGYNYLLGLDFDGQNLWSFAGAMELVYLTRYGEKNFHVIAASNKYYGIVVLGDWLIQTDYVNSKLDWLKRTWSFDVPIKSYNLGFKPAGITFDGQYFYIVDTQNFKVRVYTVR